METVICQNCKQSFTIEPEDFDFYEKLQVPPPTWCPECRNTRRMAWGPERTLYHGVCALCKKSTLSVYSPDGPFIVYCRECHKSDKWDAMDYGREYDFKMPFFTQYRQLMEAVPRPALTGTNLINSEFTHACVNVKNCYNVFWTYFSEDSQNCFALLFSRNSYDCYTTDNCDHAYESLHGNRLYRVRFGYFSDECLDSAFLYNCVGCSNCFGCVNLRQQKYCLFNERLSKEEYLTRLKYWDLGSYTRLEEAKEKFRALYLSTPHRFAHVVNGQNVSGDVIRDTKDCKVCFSALDGVQNCKFLYFGGLNLKDSYDTTAGGDTSNLLYETHGVTRSERSFFSAGGGNSYDTWYSSWARNSSDVFGCISVRNKKYCILNKQYTREEYENLASKIKKHMREMPYVDQRGRVYGFGEFFPTELSPCAYNESYAFSFYRKTKEEVLAEGWRWQDPVSRSYQTTIEAENLPDHIRDATDSIINEVIGCLHKGECNEQCTTAFRITREELAFYRDMNIALPRLCPNCRHSKRLKWRNGFHLWKRKCMCIGNRVLDDGSRMLDVTYQNSTQHFHGNSPAGGPCPNEFETTFSPKGPEIVYCEACYKSEFI